MTDITYSVIGQGSPHEVYMLEEVARTYMTEILKFDELWQKEYPEGYCRYLEIYGQRIVALYLWYLKHIRRYGSTKLFLLDRTGKLIDTMHFELQDMKSREGPTSVNGQLFPTIHDAWKHYENMIFENVVRE